MNSKAMNHYLVLLLSVILGLIKPQLCSAQDLCVEAPCNNLKIEVVRLYGINTNCQSTPPLCFDDFHQIGYKVYLKYSSTTPVTQNNSSFILNYKSLHVGVSLKVPPSGYSHIDIDKTTECFGKYEHSDWFSYYNPPSSDKPIFDVYEKSASIRFANETATNGNPCGSTGGPGNNNIRFIYGTPPNGAPAFPGTYNYYAELYTVIVELSQNEYISLMPDDLILVNYSNDVCNPITVENAGGSNNGMANYQAPALPQPIENNTTNNAKLLCSLTPAYNIGNNRAAVDVRLQNKDANTPITVKYLEFAINAVSTNLTPLESKLFEFTGSSPKEVFGGFNQTTGEKTIKLLYYLSDPFTIDPNTVTTISTIIINPSELLNFAWNLKLNFENIETKSRLKTDIECTKLLYNPAQVNYSNPIGTPSCSIQNDVKFLIQGDNSDCLKPKLRVGFYSSENIVKRFMKIEFKISLPDILNNDFSGADLSHWPQTNCSYGCLLPPGTCYSFDSKTLNYCFQAPSSGEAMSFTFDNLNKYYYIELPFDGSLLSCLDKVRVNNLSVQYLDQQNAPVQVCIPEILQLGMPLCSPPVSGKIYTIGSSLLPYPDGPENPTDVEGVIVSLRSSSCPSPCDVKETTSSQTGNFGFCDPCQNCGPFEVIPALDKNPLNGVSTYDLLLISKHILGIEALNSPYKMIAADAYKDGAITTFDIVQIRKLILGINTTFENNTSWRFVDKNFVFPNSQNAFQTSFPEKVSNITPPEYHIDFVAIKVGDINLSSTNHSRPAPRPTADIQVPYTSVSRDGIITIPIVYTGDESLEAVQFALRFDPSRWALIGPSKGDLPDYTADNFGLTQAADGLIRTLWFPWAETPGRITTGKTLFYLSFKALSRNAQNSEGLLQVDNGNFESIGWNPEGREYQLKLENATTQRTAPDASSASSILVETSPNPTTGAVAFNIRQAASGKAYLALFGAFGDRIVLHKFEVPSGGATRFVLEDTQNLPAGIYTWELHAGGERVTGAIVKQ